LLFVLIAVGLAWLFFFVTLMIGIWVFFLWGISPTGSISFVSSLIDFFLSPIHNLRL
jgi:hypothetical protein